MAETDNLYQAIGELYAAVRTLTKQRDQLQEQLRVLVAQAQEPEPEKVKRGR